MKKNLTLTILLVFVSFLSFAQKGTIRGTVIEDATGEPLFGVTVVIAGTTNGGITDFDGKFQINVAAGTHDVQASFVSFQTVTIKGLEVKAGDVTVIDQIRLKEDVELLEEVVITAETVKTTEAALLTVKRKSANLIDGISAASFRKIGDSDAAAAAKRITGVSIEGGKYVFVRGLGDRYTKTLLNGMDVPGLDPDRNTLQMDIFPTNVLNNIVVSKSFTPDLPADFTGGLVNIETKDFPDEKTMNVSVGLGYNPSMHFNSNYLTYKGGSTDWLGYDDGTRTLPVNEGNLLKTGNGGPKQANVIDPQSSEGATYISQLKKFSPVMAAEKASSFMDYSLGLSLGNQIQLSKGSLGYNIALTYKGDTDFYGDAIYSKYGYASDSSVNKLEKRQLQKGSQSSKSVLLGGLAGLAYKREKSKYKLNLLHLQNGESEAGIFDFDKNNKGTDFKSFQHVLDYTQKQLSNLLLAGEHHFGDNKWELNWKFSPTLSSISDPDIRYTRYVRRAANTLEIGTEGGFPERIWRKLDEVNLSSKIDIQKDIELFGRDGNFKFGISQVDKNREFTINNFQIIVDKNINLTGDPNEVFEEKNLWPTAAKVSSRGNYFVPGFIPRNSNYYKGHITNYGFYGSTELSPSDKLKTIIGLRGEKYQLRYTGTNQQGTKTPTDSLVVDEFNFFPSVNLIYALNESQNLRASYSRTTARFSFKEASFAQIFDPITGRTFIGALSAQTDASGNVIWDGKIKSTLIDNFDLRWELFQKRGQTVSISGFYKQFYDAIETIQFATADNNFQPRNVGDATVMGVELEFRQSLGNISSSLDKFMLSGNLSVLDSKIQMSKNEFDSRVDQKRVGQTIKNTRQLQGQSPYIVNVGIGYQNFENGLEAGLYYNVQGPTLVYTGISDIPDVFSVPFHSLNFTANKTFGEDEKLRLGLKISNILGSKKERAYRGYETDNELFESLAPGTSISFSLKYSIF